MTTTTSETIQVVVECPGCEERTLICDVTIAPTHDGQSWCSLAARAARDECGCGTHLAQWGTPWYPNRVRAEEEALEEAYDALAQRSAESAARRAWAAADATTEDTMRDTDVIDCPICEALPEGEIGEITYSIDYAGYRGFHLDVLAQTCGCDYGDAGNFGALNDAVDRSRDHEA